MISTSLRWFRPGVLGLALTLAAPLAAQQPTPGPLDGFLSSVKKTTLPNGLTLLVREQPGTGVVAINTWVKAGYFNEPDEVAGMAHLFEHMFFKGSKKFPGAEQISQELAAVGGDSNAGTIYDSTNYFFVLPTEGFGRALEIMADAIANPLFDAGELDRESEVVIEESNRKLDNPPALSIERMLAVSYTRHRIKRWRIGSNEVLRNIQRENLLQFFRTLYLPQNMILSIAGDVQAADVEKAVAATFGNLATAGFDKRRGPQEPAQTEFRYGSSTGDLKQGYSVMGWHTQGIGGDAELALDLAAQILGGGRSSRFFRHVIAPDAAATANAFHQQFDDVGDLLVQTSFDESRRTEVDRRVLAEVERLKAHGPTGYELALAKNSLRSQTILGLEDAVGQAQALAEAEARKNYRFLGDRLAALDRVTADEVRDAARRFLKVQGLTLYHYAPAGTPVLDRTAALAQVEAALPPAATAPPAEAPIALPAAFAAVPPAASDRPATEMQLANGARLVVRERPGAPSVAIGLYLGGGRSAESSANAGITQLAVSALRRGAGKLSGEEIDRSFEFLGTALGSAVTPDSIGCEMEVIAANLRPALDLFAEVVLHPTFPADGVDEEKALQLAAIRRNLDSSFQRPQALALAALWPTHPYGLAGAGTEDSVAILTAADLAAWWKANLAAEDATIVVVGDIAAATARDLVEKAFAELPRRGAPRRELRPPANPPTRTETIEFRDRKQSAIVMAFAGPKPTDPEAARLELLQNVTSGLAGTLFAELRGRRSLAYTVFAGYQPRREGGLAFAYLATEAAKEHEAAEALLTELRKLASDGFGAKELATAKSSFAGSTKVDLQTNAALRDELARGVLFGTGLDATARRLSVAQATSLDELRATAAKWFGAERFATAVLRGKAVPAPPPAPAP
ncbi:MAG: pitrilysin family protein [Thermoanaerobaculia bacterium]